MDITYLIIGIIVIIVGVAGRYLIPWIVASTTAAQRAALMATISTLVQAAEQIFKGSGRGTEKLDYVVKALSEKGIVVNVESITDTVRAMIEAAVLQLK